MDEREMGAIARDYAEEVAERIVEMLKEKYDFEDMKEKIAEEKWECNCNINESVTYCECEPDSEFYEKIEEQFIEDLIEVI